jgi:hypothetical protein
MLIKINIFVLFVITKYNKFWLRFQHLYGVIMTLKCAVLNKTLVYEIHNLWKKANVINLRYTLKCV